MNRWIVIFAAILAIASQKVIAQGFDPGRVFVIEQTSLKSKKVLENNQKKQILMSAGHIFITEEEKAIYDLLNEFNSYLDSLQNMLSTAAQIYGIYYEVTVTAKSLKELNAVVADAPSNALATAFSARRNKVYRKVIKQGIDLAGDIKKFCLGDSVKMTEAEREILLGNIRPKLNRLNKMLMATTLTIKYTSFGDVFREIMNRAEEYQVADKKSIAERALERWRNSAK